MAEKELTARQIRERMRDANEEGADTRVTGDLSDNPELPEDTVLIRAMFLTPAWGGLPGTRPAFAIMSADRGYGKTTLCDAAGAIFGAIDFEPNGRNEDKIVSRLLTPGALTRRVVRIDNLKSSVSSGLLEGLITTPQISGHRLYQGEATRPNTLTFLLTGNTLRLSRDLAERSFVIRLAKPTPRPEWRDEVFSFIHEYRQRILADVVQALCARPQTKDGRDRWQSWVDGVLSRVTANAPAVLEQNQVRRGEMDVALEEAETIWFAIKQHLSEQFGGSTFIDAATMTNVVIKALNVRWTANRVGRVLAGHIEAGRLPGVQKTRTTIAKGFDILLETRKKTAET